MIKVFQQHHQHAIWGVERQVRKKEDSILCSDQPFQLLRAVSKSSNTLPGTRAYDSCPWVCRSSLENDLG